MAAITDREQPMLRCESPSSECSPTPALGACPELSRCLSTASSVSHGSGTTDAGMRDSLGSLAGGSDYFSRHSSGSFHSRPSDASSRQSTGSFVMDSGRPAMSSSASRRRGYVRPQCTDFAASAKSRESVMSLGSIAHIQHYFARTGLLNGKGAQLARKRAGAGGTLSTRSSMPDLSSRSSTLDLSSLDGGSFLTPPKMAGSDVDSSYASIRGSPEFEAQHFSGEVMVESPILEENEDYFSDDYDDAAAGEGRHVLPPTVSTFQKKETPISRPPTIVELNGDLTSALQAASVALADARKGNAAAVAKQSGERAAADGAGEEDEGTQGWFELQGMHILDVMTLAIRAAKLYYTAHEQPDRLDAIRPEKQLRADLLGVMDVLKRMASRSFAGGVQEDELLTMEGWIGAVVVLLEREADVLEAERAERESWAWMRGDWSGRELEREHAFLASLLKSTDDHLQHGDAEPLPEWTAPIPETRLPTPFLLALRSGLTLVRLHNTAVRKSRRRFGAIAAFHVDTQKPYRAADNLRYWVKAAELRWEVNLKVDALGVVYDTGREAWADLDAAVLQWCRTVREEIIADYES